MSILCLQVVIHIIVLLFVFVYTGQNGQCLLSEKDGFYFSFEFVNLLVITSNIYVAINLELVGLV